MSKGSGSTESADLVRHWRLSVLVLFVGSVLVRLAYARWHGVSPAEDSVGYVMAAERLLHTPGTWLSQLAGNPSPMISIALLPAAAFGPGHLAEAFVVEQALFGGLISVGVCQLVARGWGYSAGLLAGVLAAIHPDFVFWTTYVLTDTLFLVTLLLVGIQLMRTSESRRPFRDGLLLAVCLLVVLLTRRAAFLLGLGVPVALWWLLRHDRRRAIAAGLGVLAPFMAGFLVLATLNLASQGVVLTAWQIDAAWSALWAPIWIGTQWNEVGRATTGVDIHYPPNFATMTTAEQAVMYHEQALAFVSQHPGQYLLLAVRKALVFWTPALPGWSLSHALFSVATLVPLYVLAWLGSRVRPSQPAAQTFAVLVLVAFTLTSMLTFVDYDQRYRLPASLGIVIFAGVGVHWALARLAGRFGSPPLLLFAGARTGEPAVLHMDRLHSHDRSD